MSSKAVPFGEDLGFEISCDFTAIWRYFETTATAGKYCPQRNGHTLRNPALHSSSRHG
jgi:hypothetical protein